MQEYPDRGARTSPVAPTPVPPDAPAAVFREWRLALFDSCEKLAYWIAGRFARHWPELESDDLAQVAALAVWTATAAYDPAVGPFAALAARSVKCALSSYARARRFRPVPRSATGLTEVEPADRHPHPAQAWEEARQREGDAGRLHRLIRALPPLERSAALADLAGLTLLVAAARRGRSRQAEQVNRRKARNRLRRLFLAASA
jgi:RNA polymerase sigma factor (sigma-70 family)